MKKTLFLQLSIFFLVIASLHSFSMPQMPANHHAQKAAVSGDELHELTVGKYGEEKAKSLWNSLGFGAESVLLLDLSCRFRSSVHDEQAERASEGIYARGVLSLFLFR